MKPSHLNAPRTLAECQWVTGYTSAGLHHEESAFYRGLRAAVCLAAAVAIGWLAAQGV